MALGLTLPATTFGQNADPASRPAVKRSTQRKMTISDEVRPTTPANQPATPAARATPPATQAAPLASPPSTPAAPRQSSPPPPIAAVDVNHDGVLEANEIAKAAESLRKLDKDGDGTLTGDELRPQRASRPRPTPSVGTETGAAEPTQRPPTRSRLGAVDANKDGVIDAAEIGGASQLLAKLDKDGDGKVTLEEVRSYRGSRARTPRPSAGMPKE